MQVLDVSLASGILVLYSYANGSHTHTCKNVYAEKYYIGRAEQIHCSSHCSIAGVSQKNVKPIIYFFLKNVVAWLSVT